MKDYRLVIDTLNTADKLLKDYSAQTELEIKTKGKDIPEQIAECIHQMLVNSDFPYMNFVCGEPIGNHLRLECQPSIHRFTNIECKAVFVVHVFNSYNCVYMYFKDDGFIISGGKNGIDYSSVIVLCDLWKAFKAKLEKHIDDSLKERYEKIKKEIEKLDKEQAIFDNFEL